MMFNLNIVFVQKALNTTNHSMLLEKLNHYGMCGIINDWHGLLYIWWVVGRLLKLAPKTYLERKYYHPEA